MANNNLNAQFKEPGEAMSSERAPLRVVTEETPHVVAGGLFRRFIAAFIDSMISAVVLMPLNIAAIMAAGASARITGGQNPGAVGAVYLIAMVAKWAGALTFTYFYFGYFYKTKGATPGKQLLGLRVVDIATGSHLTYKQAFLRETVGKCFFILSTLPLFFGFFLAVFRKDKRALHDLMFKTQVLRQENGEAR